MKSLVFILLFISVGLASTDKSLSIYERISVGERDLGDEVNHDHQYSRLNQYTGELEKLPHYFLLRNIHQYTGPAFKDLDFIEKRGLELFSLCSPDEFQKNYEYIRYLYRLVYMSYLHEALRENANYLYHYKEDHTACVLTGKNLNQMCRPKYSEMKKFVTRTKDRDLMKFDFAPVKQAINSKLHNSYRGEGFELGKKLLEIECGGNCRGKNSQELSTLLSNQCRRLKKSFELVCNEKDDYYGMYTLAFFKEILMNSTPFSVINENGQGSGCLSLFTLAFQKNENLNQREDNVVTNVRFHLQRKSKDNQEGQLFVGGALKKFDDRGLKNFLFSLNKKVKKLEKKKKVVLAVKKEVKLPPKVEIKKVVAAPAPKKVEVKVVAPEYSAFQQAVRTLTKEKVPYSEVDMTKFRTDFVFTKDLRDQLDYSISIYMTRAALTDMRKFDRLGEKEEPVRLLFLKYMIDHNYHQGLYNVQAILGNKFFVKNDIDGNAKDEVVLTEIRNDKSTNFKWLLTVFK